MRKRAEHCAFNALQNLERIPSQGFRARFRRRPEIQQLLATPYQGGATFLLERLEDLFPEGL